MAKKEYWVFIKKENGDYSAVRFFSKNAAEKYKAKFEEAYIKEM